MEKTAIQILSECQTKEQAQELFDNQSDSRKFIGLHTAQGGYVDVCEAFVNHSGYKKEQLVGESAYSFFHPEDMKAILQSHASITLKPEVASVEYRFRKADDSFSLFRTYSKQLSTETEDGMMITLTEVLE